jgi:hypothetical protein
MPRLNLNPLSSGSRSDELTQELVLGAMHEPPKRPVELTRLGWLYETG